MRAGGREREIELDLVVLSYPDARLVLVDDATLVQTFGADRDHFARQLAERPRQAAPDNEPAYMLNGQFLTGWAGHSPDAILQPPAPQIPPSPRVLERAAERSTEIEAGT